MSKPEAKTGNQTDSKTQSKTERPENSGGEKYMSFFDHLEELRSRLLRSLAAIVLCSIGAGIFIKRIFLSLTRSVPELYWHTPLEPYFTFLKMAIVVGLFVAFPYVLFELWRFVSPGLYKKEKRFLTPFIVSSWLLFVLGAVFVYLVMLPFITSYLYGAGLIENPSAPRSLEQRWQTVAETLQEHRELAAAGRPESATLEALYGKITEDLELARRKDGQGSTRVSNVWSVGRYVSLVLILFLAFGVALDLPVVVVLLTQTGVVQPRTLGKARPIVLVLIFLGAAILTPPDPVSQLMMGLPMFLLFELSLLLSRLLLIFKRRKAS